MTHGRPIMSFSLSMPYSSQPCNTGTTAEHAIAMKPTARKGAVAGFRKRGDTEAIAKPTPMVDIWKNDSVIVVVSMEGVCTVQQKDKTFEETRRK